MGIRVRQAWARMVGGAAAVSLVLAVAPATPVHAAGTSGSGAAIFTAIDGYQNDYDATVCTGGPQAGTVAFRDMILRAVGGGDSGIVNCQAEASDHNEGRAWDWGWT